MPRWSMRRGCSTRRWRGGGDWNVPGVARGGGERGAVAGGECDQHVWLAGRRTQRAASTNPMVRSLAAGGAASGATAAQNAGSEVLYAGMAGTLDGGGSFAGHVFATTRRERRAQTTVWTDLAASPVANDVADAGKFNPRRASMSRRWWRTRTMRRARRCMRR